MNSEGLQGNVWRMEHRVMEIATCQEVCQRTCQKPLITEIRILCRAEQDSMG